LVLQFINQGVLVGVEGLQDGFDIGDSFNLVLGEVKVIDERRFALII